MSNDWRSSPSLNVISVILSVIGLIISAFSDLSTLIKLVVMVAGLLACLYVIFGGKSRSTVPSAMEPKPVDVTPVTSAPLPAAPLPDWANNQVSRIPEFQYPQTPPTQPGPQPERVRSAAPSPTTNAGTATPAPSWKERFGMLLAAVVMFGIPGVLLFRSTIGWQHVVGIILLVLAVVGGIGAAFPELSDKMDQASNTMTNVADRLSE